MWCSNWFKTKSVEMSAEEEKRINIRMQVELEVVFQHFKMASYGIFLISFLA